MPPILIDHHAQACPLFAGSGFEEIETVTPIDLLDEQVLRSSLRQSTARSPSPDEAKSLSARTLPLLMSRPRISTCWWSPADRA